MTPEETEIFDRNARLARAMGYQQIEKYHKGMKIIHLVSKANDFLRWEFGDNPDGHFAKDRLLRWLGEDPDRWGDFADRLCKDIGGWELAEAYQLRALMLAMPDQIANATDAALKDLGFYGQKGISYEAN